VLKSASGELGRTQPRRFCRQTFLQRGRSVPAGRHLPPGTRQMRGRWAQPLPGKRLLVVVSVIQAGNFLLTGVNECHR